jgi:hypothetical protein
MTVAELKAEVQARGFNYVSGSRILSWLNRVYNRACERYPWPFLETTTSSTAPLSLTNLRNVVSVVDTTADQALVWEDLRSIREEDPTLSITGTPTIWYLDGTSLNVYPVNTTDTISVRYLQIPTALALDSDTPSLLPSRYHYILVDGVVAMAYEDSDNLKAAESAWGAFDGALQEMADVLLVSNYDTAAELLTFGSVDW